MKTLLVPTHVIGCSIIYFADRGGSATTSENPPNKVTPTTNAATPMDTEDLMTAAPTAFVPGCTLPFESIKGTNLAIDGQCDKDGTAKPNYTRCFAKRDQKQLLREGYSR